MEMTNRTDNLIKGPAELLSSVGLMNLFWRRRVV